MKFGFSGEAFGNLMVLDGIITVIVIPVFYFIARRRGVDIASRRLQIKVLIIWAIIFGFPPLWLSDLTIKQKTIVTVLALAGGAANYFGLDMMKRKLTGQSGGRKDKEENKE